jgi:hypothetical protein
VPDGDDRSGTKNVNEFNSVPDVPHVPDRGRVVCKTKIIGPSVALWLPEESTGESDV